MEIGEILSAERQYILKVHARTHAHAQIKGERHRTTRMASLFSCAHHAARMCASVARSCDIHRCLVM